MLFLVGSAGGQAATTTEKKGINLRPKYSRVPVAGIKEQVAESRRHPPLETVTG